MAAASHIYGRNASFRMEDVGGTKFVLTSHGNNWSIEYTADMVEATTFGDLNRTHIVGITDYTVNFSGYYSGNAGTKPASLLYEVVGASQGTWFQGNPSGSTATSPGYSGCVHVESLSVETPVDGIVTISFTLRPRSGSLTYAADAHW
jgi:hypothetical protein